MILGKFYMFFGLGDITYKMFTFIQYAQSIVLIPKIDFRYS